MQTSQYPSYQYPAGWGPPRRAPSYEPARERVPPPGSAYGFHPTPPAPSGYYAASAGQVVAAPDAATFEPKAVNTVVPAPLEVDTIQPKRGGLGVLEEDKPKIVFYGAMMAIQNFGFFVMYYQNYPLIPLSAGLVDCEALRFWVGFFALDCFVESFVCLWMAMGGYTNDPCMFKFMWIVHLIVALPYCISTVGIPVSMYNDSGKACRTAAGTAGDPILVTYWVHCTLFLVYVWMMLSITYFSFLKPKCFGKKAKTVSPSA